MNPEQVADRLQEAVRGRRKCPQRAGKTARRSRTLRVITTGSDRQQHADHPASASECASVGSEIPRASYTIVVQGRAW